MAQWCVSRRKDETRAVPFSQSCVILKCYNFSNKLLFRYLLDLDKAAKEFLAKVTFNSEKLNLQCMFTKFCVLEMRKRLEIYATSPMIWSTPTCSTYLSIKLTGRDIIYYFVQHPWHSSIFC